MMNNNVTELGQLGNTSLKQLFNKLIGKRSHKDDDWLDYAGWSLPYLFPEDGDDVNREKQRDYQSVGAQAVNSLANKIVSVILPQKKPFFKYELSQTQRDDLSDLGITEADATSILALAEKQAAKNMNKTNIRTKVLEAVKALIVLGNSLLYIPDRNQRDNKAQVYSLKDYVILRDMAGTPYLIITRDSHVVATLPEDIRSLVNSSDSKLEPEDTVTIFTAVERTSSGKFRVWQEIEDLFKVPRKEGNYAKDELPWIPLAWNLTRGHNYATGLMEEYAGAFHGLSTLSESIVAISAIVADIKILVDPMSSTDINTLNNSESGTYVHGRLEDIAYLQIEKLQDLKFLNEQMNAYKADIGIGFLLNSAVTRDAERVTAEEIRMQANELEQSLGGVYGRLSEELQLPLAILELKKLGTDFKGVEPVVITGVESLSRTSELDDLMLFFRDLSILVDLPEPVQERLAYGEVVPMIAAPHRVDTTKILLDEDTVEENRKQRLAQENQGNLELEQVKQQTKGNT